MGVKSQTVNVHSATTCSREPCITTYRFVPY